MKSRVLKTKKGIIPIHFHRIINICAFASLHLLSATSQGQALENVLVETYYITDENDAAISGSDGITAGMTTYRVFVEVCDECRLISLFSNEIHPIEILSTEPFYNSQLGTFFGHNNNSQLFPLFDSPALDSYLTLGAASNSHWGLPKNEDTNGSIWEGRESPDGLTNNVSEIGTPLPDADGLLTSSGQSTIPQGWNPPTNTANIAAVFGSATSANEYISTSDEIRSNSGVVSQTVSDLILIGQFTTSGEFSFKLNLSVLNESGEEVRFVPDNASGEDEFVSPFLTFPLACGCTDPDFLEYDPSFACSEPDACVTPIVFGCLNVEACNYDSLANFDVPELCCFPDSCQGLDPTIICPTLDVRLDEKQSEFKVYPNPSDGLFYLEKSDGIRQEEFQLITVFDLSGKKVYEGSHNFQIDNRGSIDLRGSIANGTYILRISGNEVYNSMLINIL
jgi:hypothetical protein